MNKYITLENEYYEIILPEILKEYGKEILEYSKKKFQEYLDFFKEEKYGKKIKGSFLLTREDFINRIKEVAPDTTSPSLSWAKGCFYGGEIQMLIDEDPYERFNSLAHETFHLFFQKFIYEKNNWDRIVWLDEALAGNFDGLIETKIANGEFKTIIENLVKNPDLPKMCDLAFWKGNVKTEKYNGYDLFKVVGRYLIETKTQNELFTYIHNKDQILKDGEKILKESLEYFNIKV